MASGTSIKGALPAPRTVLGTLDQAARAAAQEAKRAAEPVFRRETPGRGRLRATMKARAGKSATGYQVTIRPTGIHPSGVPAWQVARWVTRGTGLFRTTGPGRRGLIRASKPWKRMTLPGGAKRWTVKGQKANPFIERAERRASPIVIRTFEQGAAQAARDLARL